MRFKSSSCIFAHCEKDKTAEYKLNLIDKSEENLRLAQKHISDDAYLNSIVSRIYYSVFQRLKYYLIANNFDYTNFLRSRGYDTKEREYSHGTIPVAFRMCYFKQAKGNIPISELQKMDRFFNLYQARIDADYNEQSNFTKRRAENLCIDAESLLELLNRI